MNECNEYMDNDKMKARNVSDYSCFTSLAALSLSDKLGKYHKI